MIATQFPPCITTSGSGHVVTQTMEHSLCFVDETGRYALCYYAKPRGTEVTGKHYVHQYLATGLTMGSLLEMFDRFKQR